MRQSSRSFSVRFAVHNRGTGAAAFCTLAYSQVVASVVEKAASKKQQQNSRTYPLARLQVSRQAKAQQSCL